MNMECLLDRGNKKGLEEGDMELREAGRGNTNKLSKINIMMSKKGQTIIIKEEEDSEKIIEEVPLKEGVTIIKKVEVVKEIINLGNLATIRTRMRLKIKINKQKNKNTELKPKMT